MALTERHGISRWHLLPTKQPLESVGSISSVTVGRPGGKGVTSLLLIFKAVIDRSDAANGATAMGKNAVDHVRRETELSHIGRCRAAQIMPRFGSFVFTGKNNRGVTGYTYGKERLDHYTTTNNVEAWTYWVQGLSHYRGPATN